VDAEWDEKKRLSNIAKHGIDFADAARVFNGPIREREEQRRDYGEDRFSVVGDAGGRLLYVVFARRDARIRIISARRASRDEREEYYKGLSQGSS
jgi:uncharacterized DUF497 family protein